MKNFKINNNAIDFFRKNKVRLQSFAAAVIVAGSLVGCTKEELKSLERIVTMYLDYAEDQAERHIPMTMEDWKGKLDVFLQFNEIYNSLSIFICFSSSILSFKF